MKMNTHYFGQVKIMKNIILAIASVLTAITSFGQITGVGLARSEQKEELMTQDNDKVIREVQMQADIVVCGGGLAGVCAAVSAARGGSEVILVQDRPMLGGNASSEMRMGIVGVKEDQCQEAGIIEELQCRNFYYNPLQRYTLWDDVIYSTVIEEPNIRLFLNTSVEDVVMDGENIGAVKCWNSNNYTKYTFSGKLFTQCGNQPCILCNITPGRAHRIQKLLPLQLAQCLLHRIRINTILHGQIAHTGQLVTGL